MTCVILWLTPLEYPIYRNLGPQPLCPQLLLLSEILASVLIPFNS